MNWYIVVLEVDPELHYKVHSYEREETDGSFDADKVFTDHHLYPQALFIDLKFANEYAAYRNLKLYQ